MANETVRRAFWLSAILAATSVCGAGGAIAASAEQDRVAVAQLDTDFQRAVRQNDANRMAEILHPDMVLILGDGRVNTRAEQLQESRDKVISYDIQDEYPGTQAVRVHGDTAIVTARLHIKGMSAGKRFDRRLWFSDVYVRTADGWRYWFGQASLALPEALAARR